MMLIDKQASGLMKLNTKGALVLGYVVQVLGAITVYGSLVAPVLPAKAQLYVGVAVGIAGELLKLFGKAPQVPGK